MTENVTWHPGAVSRGQRQSVTGGRGLTVWLTGLSGSGKSTVAAKVEAALVSSGRASYTLDGDNVIHIAFGVADAGTNVGENSALLLDNVRADVS